MIRYLLDTDTYSYYAKRKYSLIQTNPGTWAISAVSHGEVPFGLEAWHFFIPSAPAP